jgi:hypothetical protein
MKLKTLLCLLPLGLAGCAGYNHTLFMTKSNVGLDFDSKPPTLEINVSRKEAVIAPSFEGGQTPPVMASFKPSAGTGGGFVSFFLGVDQTFAGGDAAMAMAQLYNEKTSTNLAQFNSALTLSKKPDYTDPFRKIPGTGATRPLIFGTDTSLGLKAAWTGTGGQVPDTVKLGFSRKEFAWAPITATPVPAAPAAAGTTAATPNENGPVHVKMPAFLATIESNQRLDTNGARIAALQYFATGNAATYLAMREEVRAAMHARLDPNSKAFKSRFSTDGLGVFADILFSVDTILKRRAKDGDKTATALLEKLNSLQGLDMPDKIRNDSHPEYSFNEMDPAALLLEKNIGNGGTELPLGKKLADVTSYMDNLGRNISALTAVLDALTKGKAVQLKKGTDAPVPITPNLQTGLAKELVTTTVQLQKLQKDLGSNRDVIAADLYVQTMISSQK